jgi:hypothetical protein
MQTQILAKKFTITIIFLVVALFCSWHLALFILKQPTTYKSIWNEEIKKKISVTQEELKTIEEFNSLTSKERHALFNFHYGLDYNHAFKNTFLRNFETICTLSYLGVTLITIICLLITLLKLESSQCKKAVLIKFMRSFNFWNWSATALLILGSFFIFHMLFIANYDVCPNLWENRLEANWKPLLNKEEIYSRFQYLKLDTINYAYDYFWFEYYSNYILLLAGIALLYLSFKLYRVTFSEENESSRSIIEVKSENP